MSKVDVEKSSNTEIGVDDVLDPDEQELVIPLSFRRLDFGSRTMMTTSNDNVDENFNIIMAP